ncbi:hypothetical protein A2Z22_03620 [Candidatus Woesebacteria bacterium RBG_16_34_12]|uniref:Glycosyl transferase family 1 domain-containing protein n=1 Tax=Candidatus Woesebacteria bacterium RBG_16_34_12 TaxID=1802480 RepID=A0A1F7X812_9BACT|nr:MAG: hypothetical protein A2Z22_03620 [Candidatus Woesebacteria bacterium RBG_16_34_12]
MKFLFVYQFCTMGGVETVLRNRLKALVAEEFKFDILFLHDFGGKSIFNDFVDSVYIINDTDKIIDLIEKEKYDCIINIDTPQILLAVNKLSYHSLSVLEVHTTYEKNLDYLKKINKTNISAIITPSNYMVNVIKQKIPEDIPIYVIPNSIGNQFLKSIDTNSMINIEKKLIGWVGRFDYIKNLKDFIEIAKYLKSSGENFEFWVVGSAAASESVKEDFFEMAKSRGILSSLRWFPKIDYTQMPNFYKLISNSGGCFISTSINESFGMTVLESMASKCPVVAADVGGLTELLDNGKCGLLYQSHDIEQAVISINKLSTDIELRKTIIDNAYANVLANYTSEKVVSKWINLVKNFRSNFI